MSKKCILAIGAHVDDVFIGVGGLLLQAVEKGHKVVILSIISDFSTRFQTRGQEQETIDELQSISSKYQFEHRLLGRPYHQSAADDLQLKQQIAEIKVEIQPDMVFIHHAVDHWPDHRAAAQLSQDAVMFSSGITKHLDVNKMPDIYAYPSTPVQTYEFKEDTFVDITDVFPQYLQLIAEVDACTNRMKIEDLIRAEYRDTTHFEQQSIPLTEHGRIKLAECLRWGDLSGVKYALAYRQMWGHKPRKLLDEA